MADRALLTAQATAGIQGANAYAQAQDELNRQRQAAAAAAQAAARARGAPEAAIQLAQYEAEAPLREAGTVLTQQSADYRADMDRAAARSNLYALDVDAARSLIGIQAKSKADIIDKQTQAQIALLEAQRRASAGRGGGGGGGGGGGSGRKLTKGELQSYLSAEGAKRLRERAQGAQGQARAALSAAQAPIGREMQVTGRNIVAAQRAVNAGVANNPLTRILLANQARQPTAAGQANISRLAQVTQQRALNRGGAAAVHPFTGWIGAARSQLGQMPETSQRYRYQRREGQWGWQPAEREGNIFQRLVGAAAGRGLVNAPTQRFIRRMQGRDVELREASRRAREQAQEPLREAERLYADPQALQDEMNMAAQDLIDMGADVDLYDVMEAITGTRGLSAADWDYEQGGGLRAEERARDDRTAANQAEADALAADEANIAALSREIGFDVPQYATATNLLPEQVAAAAMTPEFQQVRADIEAATTPEDVEDILSKITGGHLRAVATAYAKSVGLG